MTYSIPPTNINPNPVTKQEVVLKPRLGGFLWAYIIFSLPGFLISLALLLLTVLFIGGLILGAIFGAGAGNQTSTALTYNTIQKGNTENGILIYDLTGAIDTGNNSLPDSSRLTGIYTELVAKDFARIKQDSKIKGVVFRVNTPGGSVFASEVLADQIDDLLSAKGQKDSVFFFDQIAASGGLWAAYKTNNNYVVGSSYGQTGSIGVLMELANIKGLADKVGYQSVVIKSSQNKDIGNPFRDLSSEERSFLQKQVDDKYNQFIDIVAQGRNLETDKVKSFANGFVYDNYQAKDYGLINELGDVNTAVKKAASVVSLSNYSVYEVNTELSPFSSLFEGSAKAFGVPQNASKALDKALTLESGKVYAIDPNRI
jgi:signal peptide peptidase SppA